MNIEHRTVHAEVRTSDADPGIFEAVVLNYGVIDTYNTTFDAGCVRESLEERMPRITWGHDWKEVIGQYVDYKDTNTELTLVGQLDDFDAVPRAKQAHAQLKSGTIDQFSVGFQRKPNGVKMVEEREHFTRIGLDEAALVLAGSVPGTKLVSVRSARPDGLTIVRQVPVEFVVDLGKKIAAGELTHAEAEAALTLAAGQTPQTPVVPTDPPGLDDSEAQAVVEAQEALAELAL
jgi:HK97 family phage prohead protease